MLVLFVASICALAYIGIASRLYKLWTYEDETDVRNLLLKWIRRHFPTSIGAEYTWRYDVIEDELEIKPGSIRKCFSAVAKQTGLRIIEEGRTTVRVCVDPSQCMRHEPPTHLM
jgi:cytochrome c oxidase assembly protein Cox11